MGDQILYQPLLANAANLRSGYDVSLSVDTMIVIAVEGNPPVGESAADPAYTLFTQEFQHLAGWCGALVGNATLGEDMAAEAFVRLLAHWPSVRAPNRYLFAVGANLVRDYWRRQSREHGRTELVDRPDTRAHDVNAEVHDLLRRLPDRLRVPVILHYWADLTVAEIAKATHRPVGSVKRQLAEARAVLRAGLEDPHDG